MNLDIWYHILSLLNNDLDKINLIRTCKNMTQINVIFTEQHELIQIMKSSLYNNYSNIHVTSGIYLNNYPDFSFPKNMRKIAFNDGFNQSIKGILSFGVTHITFGFMFRERIHGCIPSSVTHLSFGRYFRGHLYKTIPTSVTHLVLGHYFDTSLEYCIPNVTHLTLDCSYRKNIIDNIPSVTHLTFREKLYSKGYTISFAKMNTPKHVTNVELPDFGISMVRDKRGNLKKVVN